MNTIELISSLKLKGTFPEDNFFSDAEYLTFLNDQLKMDLLPLLLRLNEEYFLDESEISISPNQTYRIPKRAVGAKLRDVKIKDSSGNYKNLMRLWEEDKQNSLTGYYIKRNKIELSNDLNSGTLVLSYFVSPSKLVNPVNCGQVVSIDSVNNQVVVNASPTTFSTNTKVDIVQNNNPYDILFKDAVILGVSGTTISFSSLPSDLEVGDWICIANESPVPQIPEELHPLLVQSALVACLASKKDKAAESEFQKLMLMKDTFINMLDPRVESNDSKIRPAGLLSYFRTR